jgi:hypothetical protein
VTVLQAGAADWNKGFEKLGIFGYFLEETKSCAADIFVWMLLKMTMRKSETTNTL